MVRVCIVSPAWGRLGVTRLVLSQRQRLCVELASRGVEAVSIIAADDENLDVAAEYGTDTIRCENRPVAKKCNHLFRYARETYEPDFICWVGSDDWIHPDTFDPLLERTDDEPIVVSANRFVMVDLTTGQLQRIKTPPKYGAIPWLIDSRLFTLHPRLRSIKPDLNRGLDGALYRGLRLARIPFELVKHETHEFRCVDFKSDRNLTPFAGLAKNLGDGEPEEAWGTLAKWYPADLVEQAERLSQECR